MAEFATVRALLKMNKLLKGWVEMERFDNSARNTESEAVKQLRDSVARFALDADSLMPGNMINASDSMAKAKTNGSERSAALPGLTLDLHPGSDKPTSSAINMPVADNKVAQHVVLNENAEGSVVSKIALASDGTKFVDQLDPTTHNLIAATIIESNGFTTTLREQAEPLRDNKIWEGQRLDPSGKTVANVKWEYGLLFNNNLKDHSTTVEKFDHPGAYIEIPKLIPVNYDADLARYSFKQADGTEVIRSVAPGHVEEQLPNAERIWDRGNGEISKAFLNMRQAEVSHQDGSSISVFPDGGVTISYNNTEPVYESLNPAEKSFVDSHPQINDLRDLAQIHLRFQNRPDELSSFYSNLEKFDASKQLSSLQKTDMQIALMHHVACPEEIWQGDMGSCNVSQIERELAVEQPARLAGITYDAAENAVVKTAGGQTYNLDRSSLLPQDNSFRDIASRTFENAALQLEFAKHNHTWVDTPDGARVYNVPAGSFDAGQQAYKFNGLNLAQEDDVSYDLSGEAHSEVRITNAQDLYQAFKDNDGRLMTVEVEGKHFPIVPKDEPGKGPHLVTVTDVEQVAPGKFKVAFENQWGLAFDHSTPQTMVDGDAFVQNGLLRSPDQSNRAARFALASIRGLRQNSTYALRDGAPNLLYADLVESMAKF